MNKRRLLALAKFLEEKVPSRYFDFNRVVGATGRKVKPMKRLTPKCGAVGCAMGWAPSVPCLRQDGWRLRLSWREGDDYLFFRQGDSCHVNMYDAARKMFGLGPRATEYLFLPGGDFSGLPQSATPKQVAEHIRAFVKRGGIH